MATSKKAKGTKGTAKKASSRQASKKAATMNRAATKQTQGKADKPQRVSYKDVARTAIARGESREKIEKRLYDQYRADGRPEEFAKARAKVVFSSMLLESKTRKE